MTAISSIYRNITDEMVERVVLVLSTYLPFAVAEKAVHEALTDLNTWATPDQLTRSLFPRLRDDERTEFFHRCHEVICHA